MSHFRKYGYFLFSLLLLSCSQGNKKLNERITLWRKDKIPYGTYFAYENLKYIFPKSEISINTISPSAESFAPSLSSGDRKTAYIIISPQFLPDEKELQSLMSYVGNGNYLFISSFHISDSLLQNLKLDLGSAFVFNRNDTLDLSVEEPGTENILSFEYPGSAFDNYVSRLDSPYTSVLGRDSRNRPDFVKLSYKGGGAIYLQLAPLAFSNFFLLHKSNKRYYENALSHIPANLSSVYWDEYFRHPPQSNFSSLKYLLSNRSLSWALWLSLVLFLIVYVFESKRKQRLIPEMAIIRNSSLDFVKTIGRLYQQRKDNLNLYEKMVSHFLDHVRTRYSISTATLDQAFVDRLAYKSGTDKQVLRQIVDTIVFFQHDGLLTDQTLLEFNNKLEIFYKQA